MTPMKRPAVSRLKACTVSTFQRSGRRSLLLTGDKGIGKTTLLESLLENRPVPGLRSYAVRDGLDVPVQVLLERRGGGAPAGIAQREEGALHPCRWALDGAGTRWLRALCRGPGEWAAIDEIGFLEQASARYQRALLELFARKRLLAVVRKGEAPLLRALLERKDCLVLDLSRFAGGRFT